MHPRNSANEPQGSAALTRRVQRALTLASASAVAGIVLGVLGACGLLYLKYPSIFAAASVLVGVLGGVAVAAGIVWRTTSWKP